MLDRSQPLAIYMEGQVEGNVGKMGVGILRYSPNPLTCVIDSVTAGRDVAEVTGVPRALEFEDTVVGLVEYRDGSIIDVIRKIQE